VNRNKPINFAERKVCQAMPDKRAVKRYVKFFRRTEAGRAASEDKNSGLSVEYRRILEQTGAPDGLCPLLSSYSKARIVEWLGQLMTLCMIESGLETGNQDHLRFTGRFKVSELAAVFNERS
jgi:hypothetical protein